MRIRTSDGALKQGGLLHDLPAGDSPARLEGRVESPLFTATSCSVRRASSTPVLRTSPCRSRHPLRLPCAVEAIWLFSVAGLAPMVLGPRLSLPCLFQLHPAFGFQFEFDFELKSR